MPTITWLSGGDGIFRRTSAVVTAIVNGHYVGFFPPTSCCVTQDVRAVLMPLSSVACWVQAGKRSTEGRSLAAGPGPRRRH